ncbi:hypothetical protein HY009_04010 [Candidatus Acetothermia bacterium]|nr:hypothetical protein [Candidatus Acetothermia bacterium]
MRVILRKYRVWWVITGLLSLALVLTFFFGDWIRDQIIKPIRGQWLYLQIYFSSLPGLPIWMIFMVIATLALAIALLDLFKQKVIFENREMILSKQPLRDLAEKIELASRGNLFRWSLNRELSEVAIALIMMHEQVDAFEARRRFNSGVWTDNAEIKNLLTLDLQPGFKSWLSRFFNREALAANRSEPRAQLEKIVAHLEQYVGQGGMRATD